MSSTMRLGGGVEGSPLGEAPPCYIKNVSGESIPAYSFVKVTQITNLPNGLWVVNGDHPDLADGSQYVVSGRAAIASGGYGTGFWIGEVPVWVKLQSSSAVETIQEIGPANDTWTADDAGTGFQCVGVDDVSTPTMGLIVAGVSSEEPRLYFLTMGDPASGKLVLTLSVTTIVDDSPVVTSGDVEIFVDSTLADLGPAFAAHASIDSGQIIAHAAGVADDNDSTSIYPGREFWITAAEGLTLSQIEVTAVNSAGLLGGAHVPYTVMREDR